VAAAVSNLVLSLCLAYVNFEHWGAYRQFIGSLPFDSRTWMNGELGIRFYAESRGALPVAFKQIVQAGDWVVSSEMGFALPVVAPLSPVREQEIRPTLPLRLIGVNSKSAYYASSFGLRPFDISNAPVDRVRAEVVRRRNPTLSWLPMNAPEAGEHILTGIYQLEEKTRWMSGRAVVALAAPPQPTPLEVQLYLPPAAPAKKVRILVDGSLVYEEALPIPNLYAIRTPPVKGTTVTIELDKAFRGQGDFRELGAVLIAVGYRAGP
jgi:hypothetical protein